MDDIEELLNAIENWRNQGESIALATVLQTWGSSPRAVGSHLVVNENAAFVGSVSAGCIESAVIGEALAVIEDGLPRTFDANVADDQIFELGLSCGGRTQIYIEKIDEVKYRLLDRVRQLYRKQAVAIATHLNDGSQIILAGETREAGDFFPSTEAYREALDALQNSRSGILSAANDVFVCVYHNLPNLFVIGAVHIAQCLAAMAKQAGFAMTVIDPRTAFATKERFADAPLITEWPDEALAKVKLTAADAVVTLSHDPKLDDAALATALRSPAFYIGALGSRRSHVQRVARLRALGFDQELDRIHGPVGLPLGGRAPAEIAVSILAHVIQERYAS